jgi:Heterokaryon incompatibility protein (HET)
MPDSPSSRPYPDLRLPEGKIRLLRISRKLKTSISGELKQMSLEDCREPFMTVSYVWGGDKQGTVDITVKTADFRERAPLTVAPSVAPILELIRDHPDLKRVEYVWIDGISINQLDDIEKSSQVEMMGKIYERSEMTIVWLGGGDPDVCNMAMDFIEELLHWEPWLRRNYVATQLRATPSDLQNRKEWKALSVFFSLPWWKRVWTLQEFIVAKRLKFYWGERRILWSELEPLIYTIWLCDPFNDFFTWETFLPAWNRRRMRQWYLQRHQVGKKSLLACMSYHSDSHLSDERDRVYGALAMVNAVDREIVGRPRYGTRNDVLTLYRRLVRSWIQTHQSLDIICFAELFTNNQPGGPGKPRALPSWVPDWREARNTFVIPLLVSQSGNTAIGNFRTILDLDPNYYCSVYAASGREAPRIRPWENLDQIVCGGIRVDTIDGLGWISEELPHGCLVQSTSLKNARGSDPSNNNSLLDCLVKSLVLDREDRYLGTPAPLEHFRHDFQRLAAQAYDLECSSQHKERFTAWYQHNRTLLIGGSTIEEICKARPIRNSGRELGDVHRSFVSRFKDTTARSKMGKRLVTTSQRLVGMGPPRAQRDDVVCVLFGCSVPVVLRAQGDGTWSFIGECYLHGYMDGEALLEQRKTEEFILS